MVSLSRDLLRFAAMAPKMAGATAVGGRKNSAQAGPAPPPGRTQPMRVADNDDDDEMEDDENDDEMEDDENDDESAELPVGYSEWQQILRRP